jgi:uncharacterized protein (DUF2147 family)
MMKKILFLAFFLVPFLGFSEVKTIGIKGVWLTEIQDAKIEIYQKSNMYYGRVVWLAEPNGKDGKPIVDENNPNSSLQKRAVFGIDILIGLVSDNDGAYEGQLYDPKDGETYTCKVWISGSTLKVRGYLGWLYSTKTWTKA